MSQFWLETAKLLNSGATHAEKVDRHPECTSVLNCVNFRLTTYDTDGVTERDVELAKAIDRLA